MADGQERVRVLSQHLTAMRATAPPMPVQPPVRLNDTGHTGKGGLECSKRTFQEFLAPSVPQMPPPPADEESCPRSMSLIGVALVTCVMLHDAATSEGC